MSAQGAAHAPIGHDPDAGHQPAEHEGHQRGHERDDDGHQVSQMTRIMATGGAPMHRSGYRGMAHPVGRTREGER